MSKAKPTREQITEALDTLGKWFPEEAPKLVKYREAVVDHIFRGTDPAPGSPLASLTHEHAPEAAAPDAAELAAAVPGLSPCTEACLMATTQAVLFVFGLVGLHVSNQERIARALLRELGQETLRGFDRAILAIKEADGAMAKAKALFKFLGQVWKAGGFKAAFKAAKSEMSWWDWTKTAITAVAQITAWFASDGAAFIAEAVLNIMSAVQLIEACNKVAKECF